MKRFALAALTLAALGLGMVDGRPAAHFGGGQRSAAELVGVRYRPTYRQERRAWRRERERQAARRAYRGGRRDAHYRGRY